MKKYTMFIILLAVSNFERRKDAEEVLDYKFDCWEDFWRVLEHNHANLHKENVLSFTLSEFADYCNDEEVVIGNYWITFINIAQPEEIEPVYGIIERKKQGIDCTEEESAEIKGWLRELKLPFEQPTISEIQLLFPQEYGEFLDEVQVKKPY
jgi:hypothetical protein